MPRTAWLGAALTLVLPSLLLLAPADGAPAAVEPSAPYEVQGFFTGSAYVEAVAVDEARHRVYVSGNDKLTAYDSATNTVVWRTNVSGAQGATVDPLSGVVYVTGFLSRIVQVVNPANGAVTDTIEVGVGPNEVALDPRTHTLYVANDIYSDPYGFYGLGVSQIPQAAGEETADIPVNASDSDGAVEVAVDSDDGLLYVSQRFSSSKLSVIDAESHALLHEIDLYPGGWVHGIAVDEERGKIWVASGSNGEVIVIDQQTHTIEDRWDAGYSMWDVAINPEQGLVFVTDQGCSGSPCGKVLVFDAETNEQLASVPIGAGTAHRVAVDTSTDKVYVSDITNNRVVILGVPPLYGPGTIGFSARSYTVDAGDTATVTVKRVGDLNLTSTVAYSTAPGTAVPGTDYTPVSGTLTFPAGASTATFTVPTARQGDPEAMPTVQLSLGTVTGGSLRDPHTATLRLREAVPPLMVSGSPPDTAQVGAPYTFTYGALGDPAASFSVTDGALPPGLSLTGAGKLAGTPTQAGTFSFRVAADNGVAPASASRSTLLVKQAPTITSGAPPSTGTAGTYYFHSYTASGTPAPTFSLASGTLPCGLQLFANGAFGGTPTSPGTFQFQVKASNGASPDAVTPTTTVTVAPGTAYAPGPPAVTGVTTGDQTATVSFSPPVCGGGSPITSYTVTASPGGATATGSGGPLTVTGLTNGTSYTFTVKATNAVGTSGASAPSAPATPGAVAPTSLTAAAPVAVVHGAAATLRSRLTSAGNGLGGRSVTLMSRTAPAGPWSPVSVRTTDASGQVSAVVRPSRHTSYRFVFAGAPGYQSSASGVSSVTVAASLTIALGPTKVKQGKKAKVYGVAQPLPAGTLVTLQELRKGTWTKVGTARLAAQKLPDGTSRLGYVISVKLSKGKHKLRVVSPATSSNAAGTSPTVTLKVTKP